VQSSLDKAYKMFIDYAANPRCFIAGDGKHIELQPVTNLFDVNGWCVTTLDVHSIVDQASLSILNRVN
jgi:hypothetical protein